MPAGGWAPFWMTEEPYPLWTALFDSDAWEGIDAARVVGLVDSDTGEGYEDVFVIAVVDDDIGEIVEDAFAPTASIAASDEALGVERALLAVVVSSADDAEGIDDARPVEIIDSEEAEGLDVALFPAVTVRADHDAWFGIDATGLLSVSLAGTEEGVADDVHVGALYIFDRDEGVWTDSESLPLVRLLAVEVGVWEDIEALVVALRGSEAGLGTETEVRVVVITGRSGSIHEPASARMVTVDREMETTKRPMKRQDRHVVPVQERSGKAVSKPMVATATRMLKETSRTMTEAEGEAHGDARQLDRSHQTRTR